MAKYSRDKGIQISEKEFETQVKHLAALLGWGYYHTHRSQFSPAGFPDCVMGRLEPQPRLVFAELKSDKGQLSAEQYEWLELLQYMGGPVEAYLWLPDDFDRIVEILERSEVSDE